MKTKSRPVTLEQWRKICHGRVTTWAWQQYHPRLKTFTTMFAPKAGGILLKTSRGLKFKTRVAAIKAGKDCVARMRLARWPTPQ